MDKKETQIKDTTAFLMIFFALCFDGIQAMIGWIPIAGNILADLFSIFIFMTFFLWFHMYGIKMITPKRLGSLIGGGVIEMIPFVNILPAWTCVVVYLIGTTRVKELAAKHPTLAKGAMAVGGKIKSMNKPGTSVRVPFVDTKEPKRHVTNQSTTTSSSFDTGVGIKTNSSRFNLAKPEGYYKNRVKKTTLDNQDVPFDANFLELNKTGQKVTDEAGSERVITGTNYNLSKGIGLKVRGRDYSYQSKTNPDNRISAEYNKNSGEVVKMHFNSDNPYFSGRAIVDMIERIPPGSPILGGETSMSTDSFPLLLNTVDKYLTRSPDRFSVSQVGEFALNDQGKYSVASRAQNIEEKTKRINEIIDDFNQKTGLQISHARIEETDGQRKILIPKVRIIKNY